MATLDATRMNTSPMSRFGEVATRAGGDEIDGIFDLRAVPADADFGGTSGAALHIDRQLNPRLIVMDDDADALEKNDRVTIRGNDYLITDCVADGYGLTRVELMPVTDADDDPVEAHKPWR